MSTVIPNSYATMIVTANNSRFVKFTFDGDYVKNWESQGVDYQTYKVDKRKTRIAIGAGVVGVVILAIILADYKTPNTP